MTRYEQQRNFLKSNFHEFKHIKTDKIKGIAQPPIVKPFDPESLIIDLPKVSRDVVSKEDFLIVSGKEEVHASILPTL